MSGGNHIEKMTAEDIWQYKKIISCCLSDDTRVSMSLSALPPVEKPDEPDYEPAYLAIFTARFNVSIEKTMSFSADTLQEAIDWLNEMAEKTASCPDKAAALAV